MSEENKKTVQVYQETAHLYLENSATHDQLDPEKAKRKQKRLQNLIKESFSSLPSNSKIFEIGSGEGFNAKFIQNLGFDVTASDTATAFIEATQKQGVKTIRFDVMEDSLPEKYNGVFCWRVFVHFTESDVLYTLNKIYDSLEYNGIFIFNAINREIKSVSEEWVDFSGEYHMGVERYYHYFLQEELDRIISQTKFQIQSFHKEGGDNNNKWLVYVLKK